MSFVSLLMGSFNWFTVILEIFRHHKPGVVWGKGTEGRKRTRRHPREFHVTLECIKKREVKNKRKLRITSQFGNNMYWFKQLVFYSYSYWWTNPSADCKGTQWNCVRNSKNYSCTLSLEFIITSFHFFYLKGYGKKWIEDEVTVNKLSFYTFNPKCL